MSSGYPGEGREERPTGLPPFCRGPGMNLSVA